MGRHHLQIHCQVDGKNGKMLMVEHIMSIILHELLNGNDQQGKALFSDLPKTQTKSVVQSIMWGSFEYTDYIANFLFFDRHSSTAAGNDIDAAAMEFERRFHISVDASDDREHQVGFNRYSWHFR